MKHAIHNLEKRTLFEVFAAMNKFRYAIIAGIVAVLGSIIIIQDDELSLLAIFLDHLLAIILFAVAIGKTFSRDPSKTLGVHIRSIAVDWGFWLVFALFLAGFWPAMCPAAHEAARRSQCRNNLKQIGYALNSYHQRYGCYPPAYTVDDQGRRMHSWRALILPFLEDGRDKVGYDFSQPWNSPDNLAFAEKSPLYQIFNCPSEYEDDQDRRDTCYVMPVGPNLFAEGSTSRKKEDITDNPAETIAVGEMSHSGIFWTEPRDLYAAEMSPKINDPNQIGLRSDHAGGIQVLFADGAVRFISQSMDLKIFQAMTTIDGGEKVEDREL